MAGRSKTPDIAPVRRRLPATPSIDWLLRHGTQAGTPGSLLGEVCHRLIAEGLPIAQAVLKIASLDPMVASTRLCWVRDDGRVIEEIQFHGMTIEQVKSADNIALRLDFPGTGHQIEWVLEQPSRLTAEQRDYLQTVCLIMSAPLQAVVVHNVTKSLLQAYLGRRSSEKVLNGTVRRGTGEMIEAVIWISDLRDFTQLSEALSPDQVIQALNDSCARVVGAIHPFGGEVLKFIGDGLLAIFPLAPHGAKAACGAALAAARAAREGMARLDRERLAAALAPLPFGIALHLGVLTYGNIGAPDRLDFTAIGSAVNIASRIEGLCRNLSCPVLISSAVASESSERLVALGSHRLRGVSRPMNLFTLPELSTSAAPR
jgi:adenylate cyclase